MAPKRATRSNTAPETTNTTSVTNAQLQAMIDQGVTAALAARDADRNTNGDDSHISGAGVRRTERTARECTYTDFLKCQPLNFKGTEGVAGLSQWFERMESVFHISNCTVENQVKFATCTLHSVALTWWNTHVKTVGHDAAYGMPWKTLMKMMTDKYCPRNEIKKLILANIARDSRSTTHANNANNQGALDSVSKPTCLESGAEGHSRGNDPTEEQQQPEFDAIIGKDWMLKYQAIIDCVPKDRSYPQLLVGSSPTPTMEFQIDLIPGAVP
ncbi:hypothetical protein Tco_0678445 [Tanacetum coccineum]|uniref:Retrotransposon gag domain-containing protein n=1 Tax=Tanacetum coccineum TaxID=301880 RepID=A0ABQ4XF27_9ASTR